MQNRYDKCPNCMQALGQGEDTCPYCGFDVNGYEEKTNCLRPFTVLQGKYMIGRVIGMGGFGITYIGWDLNLQTYIAIKEYFPESFAHRDTMATTTVTTNENKQEIYDKGLKRYVEEARNLSKFYRLQGIVSVKDFFYENGTGYIVMEYINGVDLKHYLKGMGGTLDEATVLALMRPVFESLYEVHKNGLVHRDISPDNIMVDNEGKIKLIDFGSVRGQSAETDKTYTVILKHGYAPPEQYYAKGKQGPWTDIYSLCATMYKMLTGEVPPNGVERMEDDTYVNPSSKGITVSERTEAVLRKGLAVKATERYQNIGELLSDLYGSGPIASVNAVPQANPYAAPGNNSTSVSMQSMHLTPGQNNAESSNNKKKIGLIAGIAAAVVALIIGLVLILGGGKKKENDITTTEAPADTTEAASATDVTTEGTTEATTEANATGSYEYIWPTALSDTWRDYTASIDGTLYQFPLPYSEWKSKGWQTDSSVIKVAAGDWDYLTCYTDRAELTVVVANPGMNEADINSCFVVGFSFNARIDDYKDDFSIELSNGIKLFTSTENDIKTAFGAPESRYEGTHSIDDSQYVAIDYAGDDVKDGMDLEVSDEMNLYSISIVNSNLPDIGTNVGDISVDAPAINDKYVAPDGPSTDRFDSIITIGDKNYVLPVTFSEFAADGWTLDSSVSAYIGGKDSESTYMEKDGEKIGITLDNYTGNAILPEHAYISGIDVDMNYYTGNAVFPGGISMTDDGNKIESVYGDLGEDDFSKDEYSSFISYYAYKYEDTQYISISAYADPSTGKITDYSYSTSKKIE